AQGARERFFGNISHEIRTPLSIVMLAAGDIEHRAGKLLDRRARASLGAVTDAARKLVRLVDELLLLAAGQEGKLRTNPEPTDLAGLVGQLASAWRPLAEAAGLALAAITPGSLVALVDPVAIERVATNLVSNAVKYTPHGGRIDIELEDGADGIRISVLDTGPGIADELAGRLFGRFERSEGEDRRKSGTGLGLSLAKQLVEAHGGTINALPRATGGSELRVLLPSTARVGDAPTAPLQLQLVDDPRSAEPPIACGARLVPVGASVGTVLLAEDDARLAEMIARLLAEEYTVIVAHDGAAAVELVKQHQPELLITDVDMPGLTGIELAQRFRELTGDRLAPIVILSAMLDLGTRVAGLEAGAVDYITKPFDPHELKARVRAQFRMRDLALRLHRAEQLSALGVLTSGLAHELRNPANGVVNALHPLAQLLPEELKDPEHPVGQLLEVIGGCAEQIAFLSRQLLGFRSDGVQLELRPAAMLPLIQRSVSLAQGTSGVDMRIDIAIDEPVLCAPPLLTQVLTNLIENAAYAAGRGGWVELRGRVVGERAVLEITDSGPGVPTELRERVFQPFFTTKPPGIGTGLGLSMARDIIHRHGGVLEIRDRDARGVFAIELPHHSALDATASAM
ncbi:MAG: ATP-binding protein, partial [Kofleriaceae bacterium]